MMLFAGAACQVQTSLHLLPDANKYIALAEIKHEVWGKGRNLAG